MITRGRWAGYANAATAGAPHAAQVADRFHRVKKLREVVETLLATHTAGLNAAVRSLAAGPAAADGPTPAEAVPATAGAGPLTPRAERFAAVKRLRGDGLG